ncbi:MAG: hypothetical protein B7O98_02350 [Zestosphaera tikiterensis]|uniref:Peptide transporter n=1 Tax=Zestosphaera tikiterensis TaxID=1973259 RepID=A0A2R7Y6Y5_9CREN|nr:MAG: hypothetical protein B7O98_02350 [Zestosphaera tikiterensis]
MSKLVNALILGFLTGLLQGFIDTYGYAVTGYTTAEIAGVVAAIMYLILYKLIFRKSPTPVEHFIGSLIASGIAISTTITAGMYITYTMLHELGDVSSLRIPSWAYHNSYLSIETIAFFTYATSISVSGSIIAYVFYKHFVEKEKLAYPIGSSIARVIQLGKALKREYVLITVLGGAAIQLISSLTGGFSVDPTPQLQTILPGSSIALSMDIFVLLLALLIPLNTSVGVGIGNVVTYFVITPILTTLGLMISLPTMDSKALATAASPLISSLISGFLIVFSSYYIIVSRRYLISTFRYVYISKYLLRYVLMALALMITAVVPVLLLTDLPLTALLAIPLIILLQFFLTILTARVAGEVGTVSQATLPVATLTLFASGARGAIPYIFLDPYTGVPMPQFFAANTLNYVKAGKVLDVRAEVSTFIPALFAVLGAPITLIYGYILISVFGLNSPKLNLLRWVPVVTWMNNLYKGDISAFNTYTVLIGALFAIAFIFLMKFLGLSGVSFFGILIGATLTPDLGLLFIVASLIKYVAYRIGVDVYESLITYASLALAGAGLGVALSVTLSLIGVA